MNSSPKTGVSHQMTFVVEAKHAIEFAGDGGMPAVLSTPNLVQFLERTARHALLPYQNEDERSVGTEIELRHLAATPVGQTVTCTARIILVEGRQVTFQVEAHDGHEVIARGLHRRRIIRIATFQRRLASKK